MAERTYTAKDVLIIKNSFTYLIAYLILATIAEIFQIVANVEWSEVIPPLMVNITCAVIAYITAYLDTGFSYCCNAYDRQVQVRV